MSPYDFSCYTSPFETTRKKLSIFTLRQIKTDSRFQKHQIEVDTL